MGADIPGPFPEQNGYLSAGPVTWLWGLSFVFYQSIWQVGGLLVTGRGKTTVARPNYYLMVIPKTSRQVE